MELRWVAYALLRDNVLHHLEAGKPKGAFSALHGAAAALRGDTVKLDAVALAGELEAAKVLLEKPASELAVSMRTRAMVSVSWPLPAQPTETALARDCDFEPPSVGPGARTLDDVVGYVVRGLAGVTAGAKAGDVVEVVDL